MNRIEQTFKQGPVFAGFLMAGDGATLAYAEALIQGGVNLLELGIPFSDPVADGPVIQRAAERALKGKITPAGVCALAAQIRKRHPTLPIVLMSYYNPLFVGGERLLQQARAAGVDGIIAVDLPLEESADHVAALRTHQLEPIFIASPESSDARAEQMGRLGGGFVYYACRKGTTGVRGGLPDDFGHHATRISCSAQKPLLAGFGIGDRESARQVLKHARGFVVGSAFVACLEREEQPETMRRVAEAIDPRTSKESLCN